MSVMAPAQQLFHRLEAHGYKHAHLAVAAVTGLLARPFHRAMTPSARSPSITELRALHARLEALFEADLHNVEAGHYPRELLYDVPLQDYALRVPSILVELPRMLWRKHRERFDDLPAHPGLEHLPDYYRRTFHWQSDGWLSDRSARLYDVGVELLFGGTADVMRRMALPHLVTALRREARPRVLDLACGTGRFLKAVHAALPRARLYGVDLSAPYLALAHQQLAHVPDVSLLCESAEALPFAQGTFDAVTSVFLFHELPKDARRNVVRQALEALRPGGVFVVVDAAQLADSAELAFFLDNFQSIYHEPYFRSYVQDDLAALLAESGFVDVTSSSHFVSRVVVGRRPC